MRRRDFMGLMAGAATVPVAAKACFAAPIPDAPWTATEVLELQKNMPLIDISKSRMFYAYGTRGFEWGDAGALLEFMADDGKTISIAKRA